MALVNTSKPSAASLTNVSKPASSELWSTITTTWATETRTWIGCISFMTSTNRPTSSMVNTAKPA